MIALYGKMKRHVGKVFGDGQVWQISDDELLSRIEDGDTAEMTTLALLGTDYAAVGGSAAKLRAMVEKVTVPVLLVIETEALLKAKKPENPNVVIIVEKSKKQEVLRKAMDRYIVWDQAAPKPLPAPTPEPIHLPPIHEFVTESISTFDSEPEPEPPHIEPIPKPEPVTPTPMSPYNYKLRKLPKYAPLCFDAPEDVLAHLARKWGLDKTI